MRTAPSSRACRLERWSRPRAPRRAPRSPVPREAARTRRPELREPAARTFRSTQRSQRSTRPALQRARDAGRPFELVFGAIDSEAEQMPVKPVVAGIGVRRLDGEVVLEPLLGIEGE